MAYRTTTQDVLNAHGWFCDEAEHLGHDTTYWRIDEGSPTYGRAWRTYVLDPTNGAHHTCPVFGSGGYVGWTKAEVVQTLRAATSGMRAPRVHG